MKKLLTILLALSLVLSFSGCKADEKAVDAACDCLKVMDIDGAWQAIEKLPNDHYMRTTVNRVEQLKNDHAAGNYQQALDNYNKDVLTLYHGGPIATCMDCYYYTIAEPAGHLLEQGDVAEAIDALLRFDACFYWNPHYSNDSHTHVGVYSEYAEFYPDNAAKYVELVEQAAQAALATQDEAIIGLLEGFHTDQANTLEFAELSWAQDYLDWQEAYTIANLPVVETPELAIPEDGGIGGYAMDGSIALASPDSGQTYQILAAGMRGNSFGIYIIPIEGELSRITGTDQFGLPQSQVLVHALVVLADGTLLEANNTHANMNMTDPSQSRVTYNFNISEPPHSLFIYPGEDMAGGVLIPLDELTLTKTVDELSWE